jgi:hypothetical protein
LVPSLKVTAADIWHCCLRHATADPEVTNPEFYIWKIVLPF